MAGTASNQVDIEKKLANIDKTLADIMKDVRSLQLSSVNLKNRADISADINPGVGEGDLHLQESVLEDDPDGFNFSTADTSSHTIDENMPKFHEKFCITSPEIRNLSKQHKILILLKKKYVDRFVLTVRLFDIISEN